MSQEIFWDAALHEMVQGGALKENWSTLDKMKFVQERHDPPKMKLSWFKQIDRSLQLFGNFVWN